MHEFGYGGKWWEMVGNGGNFFTYIHELIPTWGGTPAIKADFWIQICFIGNKKTYIYYIVTMKCQL